MKPITQEQALALQQYSPELAGLGFGVFLKETVDDCIDLSQKVDGLVGLSDIVETLGSLAQSSEALLGLAQSSEALLGLAQRLETIELKFRAMQGEVVLIIDPTTTSSSAATVTSRTVTLTLKTSSDPAGVVHEWFEGSVPITVGRSSTSGTNEEAPEQAIFVKGAAQVVIPYTGTWASGETCTLTVGELEIFGTSVGGGNSVDTLSE